MPTWCARAGGWRWKRGRQVCRVTIEEALELRSCRHSRASVLEGFFEADELPLIIEHDFWCVVHSLWQLEAIEQATLSKPLTVWLKLDSGMHRVGLHPKDYPAYQRLLASGKVAKIVLMSHFARADELDCVRSKPNRWPCLSRRVRAYQPRSAPALAASVMGWPNVSSDWVRPGIMLYGATPFGEDQGRRRALRR